MYLIITNNYTNIAIPVDNDIGSILKGVDKAVSLHSLGYMEKKYKIRSEDVVTFTVVPDEMLAPEDPIVESYKDDLERAYQREIEERAARKKAEEELAKLKERFAPFMKENEDE